ncbi:MAG: stage III sporulation protein AA [Bacillota bacterium]
MAVGIALSSDPTMTRQVLPLLADRLRSALSSLPPEVLGEVEEIRVRLGRPLHLVTTSGEVFLPDAAVSTAEFRATLELVTGSSLYALEEELRNGYITLPGGHRVGLAGRAVLEDGRVRTLKHLSGLNIRVSREFPGAAAGVLEAIWPRGAARPHSALIVSPPRGGKTTVLRDLARRLSQGEPGRPGLKVVIVDERSEIAGCFEGVPQKDVGPRTDVLDACPKAAGMMMALRSLGPEVLVADEIGRPEDALAVNEALNAGVTVISSAHGSSLEEIARRPTVRDIVTGGAFGRYVFLTRCPTPGTVAAVLDATGRPLAGQAPLPEAAR